jgi:Tfp pilus assembly protein PilX
MKRLRNERGIALAVAIFALVVVGGMVAGALFVGSQEQRIGRNTLTQQQAFTAADAANDGLVSNWNQDLYNNMTVGASITTNGTAPDGKGWSRTTVQRLSQMLYLVRTDGFSKDSTARQRVGALMRLRPFQFNINAALKTQGAVKIGGSSFISGVDQSPTGWTGCPALGDTLAGIRMPDPTELTTSGCSGLTCIQGDPKVQKDTTINDSSLTTVGDIQFDSLRQYATKTMTGGNVLIEPSALNGACNTAVQTNWGEPWVVGGVPECRTYFPIIWVEGNMTINKNRGQGVLIVNGDLDVQGSFEFYGPVLVRGTINTQGTGGHFNGGVIAANVNLDQNVVLGDAVINFSSCAVIKAVTASATVGLMRDRSWINLY